MDCNCKRSRQGQVCRRRVKSIINWLILLPFYLPPLFYVRTMSKCSRTIKKKTYFFNWNVFSLGFWVMSNASGLKLFLFPCQKRQESSFFFIQVFITLLHYFITVCLKKICFAKLFSFSVVEQIDGPKVLNSLRAASLHLHASEPIWDISNLSHCFPQHIFHW